nr:MAG TPA: hypothetical protein [Caudoviricetes sp.]
MKKAVDRFGAEQSPARLLTVRTMRETPLDLKGYGICRERHCLWAFPLLILQKNSLALSKLCVPCGVRCRQSGGFFRKERNNATCCNGIWTVRNYSASYQYWICSLSES